MNLIDEAVIIEIFGIRMYAFGLYVALGALCAVLALWVMSSWLRLNFQKRIFYLLRLF